MKGGEKEIEMKKIFVIEDDVKHMADAKAVIANHAEISADFATTYKEAEKLLAENKYDGIISDIFFPYAEKTSYGLNGWSLVARNECEKILGEALEILKKSDDRRWIMAAYKWMEGSEMHPTGVMITDVAIKNSIPVVLCTDTYHHGNSTEPINIWARNHEVKMFDGYPKQDPYENRVPEKKWDKALIWLSIEIEHQIKGYEIVKMAEKLRIDLN